MAPMMSTSVLLLLGLLSLSCATSISYSRRVADLEPNREYKLKQPVLGSGRDQDCKWSRNGETIMQSKFATSYINLGLEKGEYDSYLCVLKIVRTVEDNENGSMFGLEFKGNVFQITTYMVGEQKQEALEEVPNRLDEMTQSTLTFVYIAIGVFAGGCLVFFALMKCS